MKMHLQEGPHGTLVLRAQNDRTILVQLMSDMPGVASSFGWQPCPCRKTDGTVSCEHRTASDMIAEAYRFLQTNIGLTENDPGYF